MREAAVSYSATVRREERETIGARSTAGMLWPCHLREMYSCTIGVALSDLKTLTKKCKLQENSRFGSYCPFCQISTAPSSLPPAGLRDPPTYSPPPSPRPAYATLASPPDDHPPAYSSIDPQIVSPEKPASSSNQPAEDVLHFLDPSQDTIPSLSLRYGVPQNALRRTNGLYADHLLAARRTVLIPGEHYKGGVSLSPQPIDGEEEEIRKGKVRRWMVTCKVAE